MKRRVPLWKLHAGAKKLQAALDRAQTTGRDVSDLGSYISRVRAMIAAREAEAAVAAAHTAAGLDHVAA